MKPPLPASPDAPLIGAHPAVEAVRAAMLVAVCAHHGQNYNQQPYTTHLAAVDTVLIGWGYADDWTIRCAAWLHDVPEDTDAASLAHVQYVFGFEVARLVGAVTNVKHAHKDQIGPLTWPQIAEAGARAVLLKLADRVANNSIPDTNPKRRARYVKQYPHFRAALYDPTHNLDPQWAILDTLMEYDPLCAVTPLESKTEPVKPAIRKP